jgi:predicted amidohydrolase
MGSPATPRRPLSVAAAQPACVGYDIAANAAAHAAAVRAAAARVVVFPELSLTGYELDAAVVYRKTFLGGAEPDHFAPGPGAAAIEVDDWRLGLGICKDTRIAEHITTTGALGIDAYAAGMLEAAEDAGVPEERARRIARELGIPVVIASFAGSTGGGYDVAAGGSGIWAADGTVLARAGAEVGEIARATLGGRLGGE